MRVSDIVQSFPVFILGMALVVVTGQEIQNVIYVVAIVNCPIYIRLVRSQVLSLREKPFIEAARAVGGRDIWIIREHILSNAIGPVVANASVTIGWAILLTAGLSFIGAGVRVPTPEWGSMIAVGAKNIYTGRVVALHLPRPSSRVHCPRVRAAGRNDGPTDRSDPEVGGVALCSTFAICVSSSTPARVLARLNGVDAGRRGRADPRHRRRERIRQIHLCDGARQSGARSGEDRFRVGPLQRSSTCCKRANEPCRRSGAAK